MNKSKLTIERLKELLTYNPETGLFTWNVDRGGRAKKGSKAGALSHSGYVYISIDRKTVLAHRIAWMMVHGEMPDKHVDHINGDRTDNRIANLRLAVRSQNNANAKLRKDSGSGFKGVTFSKQMQKWVGQIRVNGRLIYLGSYRTPEEAHAAYLMAAEVHFGEFARAA